MNLTNQGLIFESPLIEGIIRRRPNRFIMDVDIDGVVYTCHCPATGRIGDIVFRDIPCLLSKGVGTKRKTPYTVEAISQDPLAEPDKTWIGINQNAANRYIEHFLKTGQLDRMVASGVDVLREQKLGNSRLDFLVGTIYIEVKTTLNTLPHSDAVAHKAHAEFNSFDRFIRHITELSESLRQNQRAILLNCFLYDNPRFQVPPRTDNSEEIFTAVKKAVNSGVEIWQINLDISASGVNLLTYFDITDDFLNL